MTTMLDKCAVAGDITQGIDRRGVWTAAITVIGGTSGIAVKLVSSDTVDGEYTDYKTLISASDAETDQYKGFVVDLHGAKKYIKVTGAVMATAVFGDCDHDVKAIAITEGEVPGVADLENNKAATIDASTYTSPVEVTPSEGKYGMKKATITLSNIPTESDLEDNKTVSITENGVVEITPSAGKDGMKKVTATVNVSGGGASFFDEITLNTDNPTYNKTLEEGATVYLNYKYVNMVARGGDVTETITSIGKVFATVTYVDSTQVLTITLNTSHPEASEGLEIKVWGE